MAKPSEEEIKNKRIGMISTIGFHAALLLLFIFLLAWTEPDPPIPQYGIELSFVQSNSTGKVESQQNEQNDANEQEESQETENDTEPEPQEEVVEEVTNETEESESTESEDVEEPVEEVVEETPTEELETVATEDVNSPDIVEEQEETEPVEKVETEESTKQTANSGENENSESAKEEEKKPQIDSRAIYTASKGESTKSANSSSGGASLDLSGWIWDNEPKVKDESNETGTIVFKIAVDGDGEIIQVVRLTGNLSLAIMKAYENAVQELTFSKTDHGGQIAPRSEGTITFKIQAK
ncbi:MAG: hypothetical protein JXQ96_01400 [Cyclobacteriaceae bacterium]